jgi:hypothetical protein
VNLLKNKLPKQVGSFRMAHSAFFEIPKDLTEEEKCQIRQKEEELKSRQGSIACKRVALIFDQFQTKGENWRFFKIAASIRFQLDTENIVKSLND